MLWVKGSGGDIGSMKLDGFSTLYLDKLLALEQLYRGVEHEDEMVGYLPHCTFNLNPRPASIDTPLHAYLPFTHIDHVHPDAVIALAASSGGEAATREIWGGAVGWLPGNARDSTSACVCATTSRSLRACAGSCSQGTGSSAGRDSAKSVLREHDRVSSRRRRTI